jgi:hypothetical protein
MNGTTELHGIVMKQAVCNGILLANHKKIEVSQAINA